MDTLCKINIISGLNNTGKTSILEAIFIHSGVINPILINSSESFRGLDRTNSEFSQWKKGSWDSLFHNFNTNEPIEIYAKENDGKDRTTLIRVKLTESELQRLYNKNVNQIGSQENEGNSGSVSYIGDNIIAIDSTDYSVKTRRKEKRPRTNYLIMSQGNPPKIVHRIPSLIHNAIIIPSKWNVHPSYLAQRYSDLSKQKKEGMVIETMKKIEPRIKDMSISLIGTVPVIHVDLGLEKLLPLNELGEGMTKMCELIVDMAIASGGVLLIDEVENGIHHSILSKVWNIIEEGSKQFDVQVFITTHSYECIRAASENLHSEYCLFRLEKDYDDDITDVHRYNDKAITDAISMNFELR